MSSSNFREPTNAELWAQPPAGADPRTGPNGLAPLPPPPFPTPVHPGPMPVPVSHQRPDRTVFVLAIVTLALGIPLTAIASGTAGLAGLMIAWVGIVLVNAVYAWSRRGH